MYLGNIPQDQYLSVKSQQITGNGGSSYTLDYAVSTSEEIAVFVNNVRQNVSSYTVSGDQLTLGGTISVSDECWVLFLGRTVGTKTPAVGSVTNDMLAGSIANAKLANSSITLNGTSIALGGSETISGGKIGQIVQDTSMAVTSTTSQYPSFVDTGLSVNITLTSTNSKALIIVSEAVGSSADDFVATQLFRDSTAIGNFHQYTPQSGHLVNSIQHGSFHYLDTPSSTSQITYSVKFCNGTSTAACYHGGRSGASSFCMINVMEVLA